MDRDRECVYVQGRGEECSRVIEEKEDHFPGWWVVFPCWQGTREEGKEKKRKGGQTRWKHGGKKENIEAVSLRGKGEESEVSWRLEAAVLKRGDRTVCWFHRRETLWLGRCITDRPHWILKGSSRTILKIGGRMILSVRQHHWDGGKGAFAPLKEDFHSTLRVVAWRT